MSDGCPLPYVIDLADELSLPEYRSQRRAAGKLIKPAEMDLAEAQTEDEHSRCRGEFAKLRTAREAISRKIARQYPNTTSTNMSTRRSNTITDTCMTTITSMSMTSL